MLTVTYTDFHIKAPYAEFHLCWLSLMLTFTLKLLMLTVIMLNVVRLSVVIMSVVMMIVKFDNFKICKKCNKIFQKLKYSKSTLIFSLYLMVAELLPSL
jgi:hypothetical protein